MNDTKKYMESIVNIRALSILIVVFGHSIILYSSSWNLYTTQQSSPLLDNIKMLINIIQMPLFFSVSGYLFKNSFEKYNIITLIQTKVKRLLLPYVWIGVLYLIPMRLCVGYMGYQGLSYRDIVYQKLILGYDNGHLWFLTALFLVFLVSYLILSIFCKVYALKNIKEVLLFISALILYSVCNKISFGNPHLANCFIYMVWFALGLLIRNYEYWLQYFYHNLWLKNIALICNILLLILCIESNTSCFIAAMLSIINIYMFIPPHTNDLIYKVSNASFGIYLFYSPLIYIVFSTIPNARPVVVVFLNFVVCGFIAYILTVIIKKSRLKFLIGE